MHFGMHIMIPDRARQVPTQKITIISITFLACLYVILFYFDMYTYVRILGVVLSIAAKKSCDKYTLLFFERTTFYVTGLRSKTRFVYDNQLVIRSALIG